MSVYDGPKIITNGLVLALDAGNRFSYVSGSTTWTDITNNGNNGTLINGPTFNTGSGGSIVFDGTNDYGRFPTNPTIQNFCTNNTEFTFCSFFNKSSTTGSFGSSNPLGFVLFSNNDAGWVPGWSIRVANYPSRSYADVSYNAIVFQIGYSSTGNAVFYYPQPSQSIDNQWIHLTVTHRIYSFASTCSIYLNGNLFYQSSSLAANLPTSPNGLPTIGSNPNYTYQGSNSQGQIATYQIYNRVLTAQEVLQNYNATKTRFGL